MDLDTENRLASLLLEEARRLRMEADREGVHVYLHPKVRARPNSRFLAATVLGIQQANKAVEMDEMWRTREKELQLDDRSKNRSHDNARERHQKHHGKAVKENSTFRNQHMPLKCKSEYHYAIDDDGLRDEDIEKFLHSRAKRGRGAVGSRMDEPGPYPSCQPSDCGEVGLPTCSEVRVEEEWERKVLGPGKPPPLNKPNHGMKLSAKQEASSSEKRKSDDKHISKKEKRVRKKKERRSRYHSESP